MGVQELNQNDGFCVVTQKKSAHLFLDSVYSITKMKVAGPPTLYNDRMLTDNYNL